MRKLTLKEDSINRDLNVFLEILETPAAFEDEVEKSSCQALLEELNEDEVTEAANTSYAYWYVSSMENEKMPPAGRVNAAMKEIKRHFVGEGGDHNLTLSAIKEALTYRKEYNINILRTCFQQNPSTNDNELVAKLEGLIEEDLSKQKMVVRGRDRDLGAIVYKPPRQSPTDYAEDEAYVITQFYTAERAIATTEYISCGKQEKVVVIFSFSGYASANSASISAMKESTRVMQRVYPERLKTLLVLDSPFWMRALFAMIYPFLSYATQAKISMKSGKEEIERELGGFIDSDQKISHMFNKGDSICSTVDPKEYLETAPFYQLYDELEV